MPWIVSGLEKKSFQLITPWFRQSQWCSSRPVQGTRAWSCGLDSVKHVANSGTAIPCLATSWQTSGEASQIFTSNRLAWSIISLGQRRLRQPFSDLIIVRARLVVISIKKSLPIIPGWKFKQKKNKFKVKKKSLWEFEIIKSAKACLIICRDPISRKANLTITRISWHPFQISGQVRKIWKIFKNPERTSRVERLFG